MSSVQPLAPFTLANKQPSLPIKDEELRDVLLHLWILHYRHSSSIPTFKIFYLKGDFLKAQERAQVYCKAVGFKFLRICSFINDLELQEKLKGQGLEIV